MTDFATIRARLDARLSELNARQAHLVEALDEPVSADFEEAAVEREDDEALGQQAVLVEREMASIRRALDRIDDGSYGECVRCGQPIAPARLDARPEAALCISCAEAKEQGAA